MRLDTIAKSPHTGGERGIVPDWRVIELPAGWRYTTHPGKGSLVQSDLFAALGLFAFVKLLPVTGEAVPVADPQQRLPGSAMLMTTGTELPKLISKLSADYSQTITPHDVF